MNNVFQLINLSILFLCVGGFIFIIFALWKMMKSIMIIEDSVKKIESKINTR